MPSVPFRIHARVIRILSKQLVQTRDRAVLELVKNSFDADATTCEIDLLTTPGEITIRDDGAGMAPKTIEDGWLTLGSPLKFNKGQTKERKRWVAGSKGLGRMALTKLGSHAVITTGTARTTWQQFIFDPEAIQTVASKGRVPRVEVRKCARPADALSDRGTIITIKGVDDALFRGDENDALVRALRLLKSPSFAGDFPQDSFTIRLHNRDEKISPIEPPNFAGFHHIRVMGEVDDDGDCKLTLTPNRHRYTGPADPRASTLILDERFPKLQGVRLKWEWTLRGSAPGDEAYWTLPSASEEADALTGVYLYRDGIRVLPYGDEDQDWLRLQSTYVKRGPLRRHPRPNQVLGWLSISHEKNEDFEENPSREGLDQNEAFKQLRKLGEDVAKQIAELRQTLEPKRDNNLDPRRTEQARNEKVSEAKSALNTLNQEFGDDTVRGAALQKIGTVFEELSDAHSKLALYRERTSAGLVATLVLHDSGINLQQHIRMIQDAREERCDVDYHEEVLDVLGDVIPRIVNGYELLKGASRSGGNLKGEFDAGNAVATIVKQFKTATGRQLTLTHEAAELPVRMRESDLWSVLVNLLHNAITSDEFEHAPRRDFPPHREIHIIATCKDRDLEIIVDDNGPGLPDKPIEWMMERGNSNRRDGGSGLGLWIVNDLLLNYGGFIIASPTERWPTGARFRVSIPGVRE